MVIGLDEKFVCSFEGTRNRKIPFERIVEIMLLMYIRALFLHIQCASGSVVEHRLPKARAAGSNPVSRLFSPLTVCQGTLLVKGKTRWMLSFGF